MTPKIVTPEDIANSPDISAAGYQVGDEIEVLELLEGGDQTAVE